MELTVEIKNALGFAGLLYLSVEDIRRKELATLQILLVGAPGLLLGFCCGDWKGPTAVLSFLPGLVFLLIAHVGRECIGYGDGLVVLCLGAYLTLGQLLGLCMAALTLAGIAAIVLMFVLHRGRHAVMPFVPFLLAGYVFLMVCDRYCGG